MTRSDEFRELRNSGWLLREIAAKYGVSRQYVHRVIGNTGWSRPPKIKMGKRIPFLDRFWSQVEIMGNDECWPWMGAKVGAYGRFTIKHNYQEYAHRVAYELGYHKQAGELYVCHHCDNPVCCNPSHLFLGTARDNVMDSVDKGRWGRLHKREKH